MIAARDLDRAFDGLGTGIGEEHSSAKVAAQSLAARRSCSGMRCKLDTCQSFLAWLGQRLDQMRMRVAERGDGDPAREVEIAVARRRKEKGAFSRARS